MSKLSELLKDSKEGKKIKVKPSLINIINAHLANRKTFYPFHARIERNDIVGFHPSGLYGACPRQIAYNFIWEKQLGKEKKIVNYYYKKEVVKNELYKLLDNDVDTRMSILFDFGHLMHFYFQYSIFPGIGFEHAVEIPIVKLYDKYLIAGTADGKVPLQNNKFYVVDIKTANSRNFYKLRTKEDVPIYYKKQLKIYMLGLGISRGLILYVCKDTSDMKEFFFDADEIDISDELKTATDAKKYLLGEKELSILPECKNRTGMYKTCPFSSVCFGCKKQKDLLKMLTVKPKDLIKLKK